MKNFFFLSFNSIFSWTQRCLYSLFSALRKVVDALILKKEVTFMYTNACRTYLLFYLFPVYFRHVWLFSISLFDKKSIKWWVCARNICTIINERVGRSFNAICNKIKKTERYTAVLRKERVRKKVVQKIIDSANGAEPHNLALKN